MLDGSGTRCVDVDECANVRVCGNGTCTNVEGGFECSCSNGYAPGPKGRFFNIRMLVLCTERICILFKVCNLKSTCITDEVTMFLIKIQNCTFKVEKKIPF